ncbi:MAG: hypothetical protein M3Q56_10065 [Bacteroidota bacterium]|nr:hypothetical protein [Bacteroidota bacterium]
MFENYGYLIPNSQELERKSIGEKLHEDVAPILYLSLMDLNSLLEFKEFKFGSQLQFTINNISIAINKIRDISHLIHPAAIESFGFFHGLNDFGSILNSSQGCKLEIENKIEGLTLDSFKQLMLFRVVQEIAINSIVHGKARSINLIMSKVDNKLNILINHNGNKFSKEDYIRGLLSNESIGLKNIQHRIGLLQGEISFEAVENSNMQNIIINIPLN